MGKPGRVVAFVVVSFALVGCPKKKGEGPGITTIDLDRDTIVRVRDGNGVRDQVAYVRLDDGMFRLSFGLTSPIHLLHYKHSDALPAHCRREAILDKLGALAVERQCTASSSDVGGTPTRLVVCALPADPAAGTCAAEYVAQIWQERPAGSTEDYDLEMYARVRRVCASGQEFETFHATDEMIRDAEAQSAEVTKLLDSCKETP